MFRVALIAAALSAAPTAHAANADPAMLAASAPEPVGIAGTPASAADWTPLPPPRGAGLDFKDAATEPAPALPPETSGNARDRLIPALLALGALVVVLRKRPT
jgi:hypothetical protein